MSTSTAFSNWHNTELKSFYSGITVAQFKTIANHVGVNSNKDISLISKYILSAKSMLEVGAGYGRVISATLNINPNICITAIERYGKLVRHLNKAFNSKVSCKCIDIFEYHPKKSFDLITLMWTSISEFNSKEQLRLIQHLSKMLGPNGRLVVESIDHQTKPVNAKLYTGHDCKVENKHGALYLYVPTPTEIFSYFRESGLITEKLIHYKSKNNTPRVIYVAKANAI